MTDLERLVDLIERVTGNVIPHREMGRLQRIAEERAAASGQPSLGRYVSFLSDRGNTDEWRSLLGHITVNESYLYRGPQQFAALTKTVIPRLVDGLGVDEIRLWSAGCARGEEAVSLAMEMSEASRSQAVRWSVLGTDVDEDIIEEARLGRYGRRAVSRVDDSLLEKYFSSSSGIHRVHPELMERITYRPLNLVSGSLDLPEAPFHVVFLRNVLIYFNPVAQRRVVERVAGAMAEEGVLFVGPAESLWQLRTDLEPWDLGSCFCYRVPPTGVGAPSALATGAGNGVTSSELRVASWVEDDAEESHQQDEDGGTAREVEGRSREATIDRLAQLVAADDHATAVSEVVDACRRTPDDGVLRAIEGRLLELADEPERAVGAYRAALYLDPRSCVVRYLLAGCLVRLGRKSRARRELRALLAASSSSQCTDVPELSRFGIPRLDEIETLGRELLDRT